jgi:phage-related minor tail protein
MPAVKDFVVNILGDATGAGKAFKALQDNAGKAAAGAAAAFAGAQLGQAILGDLDAEVATDTMNAALGGTPAEAEKWANAAGSLYRGAWGENMEEAAGAVDSVVSSIEGMRDASEEDIQQAAGYALDFAKVFKQDVAGATGAVGVLIKEGLAGDAEEGFDLITAAMQSVPESMRGETLDAVSEYSRNFAALGIDGERSIGILASAASSGITSVDKIGDSLKELTIRGTDMSKATGEAYSTLGLDSQEMANALLAGGDEAAGALDKIVGGLQGIEDPAEQANTSIALFGTPLEDLGTDEIPAFLDSLSQTSTGMGDVEGAAGRMSDELNDNAKTRVEELQRSFEGWKQDLIDTEGPIGDVAVGVQAFGADAASAATSVGLGVIALSQLKVGALAARGASLLGAAATGIATAAQWAYNAALTANPIGIVIVLIAALVAGLVWFFTQTEAGQKIAKAAWAGIKNAAKATADWFTNTLVPGFKRVMGSVTGFFKDAGRNVKNAWDATVDWFKNIPNRVGAAVAAVKGKVSAKFNEARTGAQNIFNRVVDWFWNLPGRIASGLGTIAGKIAVKFLSARERVYDIFNGMVDWVRGLPGKIASAASGLWDPLWSGARAAINNIIGAWNGFSLTIGGGNIAGISVPSVTLHTPNIPYLAKGGDVQRPGLAVVGDAGPELLELPRGARVTPLDDANTNPGGKAVNINITNNYPQAEPTSVTQNRGLQYAASLGVIG